VSLVPKRGVALREDKDARSVRRESGGYHAAIRCRVDELASLNARGPTMVSGISSTTGRFSADSMSEPGSLAAPTPTVGVRDAAGLC
jgi:hypothetical protein